MLLFRRLSHQINCKTIGATLVKPVPNVKARIASVKAKEPFLDLIVVIDWDVSEPIPKLFDGAKLYMAFAILTPTIIRFKTRPARKIEKFLGIRIHPSLCLNISAATFGAV